MGIEVTKGKEQNKPGVYIHKMSGATVTTREGSEGVIQADAFIQAGYEYKGPAPSRLENLEAQKTQEKVKE